MAMRGATGKLYLLLEACLPKDDNIKARVLYNEVIESVEYRTLFENPNAGFLTEGDFSKESLRGLSAARLEQVKETVPLLDDFITKLVLCVQRGEAYDLTEKDNPDFFSAKKIKATLKKMMTINPQENITNITGRNAMIVFSPDVLKNTDDLIASVEYSKLSTLIEDIPTFLAGKAYCFNRQELLDKIAACIAEIDSFSELSKGLKVSRRTIFRRKILVTVIALALLPLVTVTGLLVGDGESLFFLIMLGLLIAFWIAG